MLDKTLEFLLNESNLRCSLQGDPSNHYLESIKLRLEFALQGDRSALAEISDAELEVLTMEIKAVKESQEKTNESF